MVIIILFSPSLVMAVEIFNGEEDIVILDVVLEAVIWSLLQSWRQIRLLVVPTDLSVRSEETWYIALYC